LLLLTRLSRLAFYLPSACQWWIQLAVVVFMFFQDVDKEAVQKCVRNTTIIVTTMVIISLVSLLNGCRECGVFVDESILVFIFGFMLLAKWILPVRFRPRPAAAVWCIFSVIAHGLFLAETLLLVVEPGSEATMCMILVSDVVYYLLFAPLLWLTMRRDTNYWRDVGARLAGISPIDSTPLLFRSDNSAEELGGGGTNELLRIAYRDLHMTRLIGTGGFAEVFKGEYNGESVAVKCLRLPPRASPAQNQRVVDALVKETRLLASLRHENVLRLVGVVAEPTRLAIVSEYCGIGALFDVIHAGTGNYGAGGNTSIQGGDGDVMLSITPSPDPSPAKSAPLDESNAQFRASRELRASWRRRLVVLEQACRGMDYLHSRDPIIIHRDIKSHNLLLTDSWECKVADFGLSRTKETSQTMTTLGTPQWMAPEGSLFMCLSRLFCPIASFSKGRGDILC
jgi:Protein tyrosine and serine/threonine kinase